MTLLCRILLLAVIGLGALSAQSKTKAAPAAALPEKALVDDLVLANRVLAHEIHVLDAYGHISVRSAANPNHYYLSRAISAGMVTAADIIQYDLDSNPVTGSPQDGYLERFIHGEIYKMRPDVKAVIHAHSEEMITFAAAGVPLRNMIHTGSFINDGVPVWDIRKFGGTADDMLVRNPALGKALAAALGNKTAIILFGHGVAITGNSLATAVSNSYFLNMNARIQMNAMRMGGGSVSYLEREPGAKAPSATPAGAGANNRAWEYWKRRVAAEIAR
ncbi:MAG TPA: class II aldolase/adducin family protein [Bryobacteraceae bacterium]|nr:class II aldolase/adducin family protein [Bryobacteraceae bacterium]